MAKMARNDLERIVRKEMPGYRLTRRPKPGRAAADARASARRAAPEARTPSLDALKRKYLGADAVPAPKKATRGADTRKGRGRGADRIVAVEPESAAHPWDRAARPKAVVISGKDKKIVGTQG
jgi:hypothetical protein